MIDTESAMVGVQRLRGSGDGRSDLEHIFGRPQGW